MNPTNDSITVFVQPTDGKLDHKILQDRLTFISDTLSCHRELDTAFFVSFFSIHQSKVHFNIFPSMLIVELNTWVNSVQNV